LAATAEAKQQAQATVARLQQEGEVRGSYIYQHTQRQMSCNSL
jgi:hypothetical protein